MENLYSGAYILRNMKIMSGHTFMLDGKEYKAFFDENCENCDLYGGDSDRILCDQAPKCIDVRTGEQLSYMEVS